MISDSSIAKDIAERITALRINKGYSMAKLAEMSGVTRSMISQVEKGDALPSLQTLNRIATALDITINSFFNSMGCGDREDNIIVRADCRKQLTLPGNRVIYNIMTPSLENPTEFVMLEVPPGVTENPFKHEGLEYFYVVEGKITLTIGSYSYALDTGDSGCFDSSIEHYTSNSSDVSSRILILCNGASTQTEA